LLALVFATGCRDAETTSAKEAHFEPGVFIAEISKPIADMESGDVIVSVNGVPLTRRDYDQLLSMYEAFYKLSRPNGAEAEFLVRGKSRKLAVEFTTRQLQLQEAVRKGITATEESRARAEATVAPLAERQRIPLPQLYTRMGENGARMRAMIGEEAIIDALRLAEHGDRIRVTEADIDEGLARLAAYNEICIATNKLVLARGKTIVEWLEKGEDFTLLADKYTEFDDEPNGEWGTFFPNEIEDANVRKAAFELPVGGFAGPFDTDEGLVIVKVVEREGVGAESVMNDNPLRVKLSRIVLQLADGGEGVKLPGRDAVRQDLERRRLQEVNREWLPKLRDAARIEYPNGTNFWPRAQRARPGTRSAGL